MVETLHHRGPDDTGSVALPGAALGEKRVYLKENMKVQIEFFEHEVIGIELPLAVELEITETSPPLKGATASGSLKPATLDNGISVRVPGTDSARCTKHG